MGAYLTDMALWNCTTYAPPKHHLRPPIIKKLSTAKLAKNLLVLIKKA